MALSVDYSVTPFLITIPKSDLTLVTGTQYQLTVDAFWSLLTDYTDNENTMAQPKLYSRIPATSSTPSITTIEEAYYALQFEDGLYSVNIINGNTNIREVEVKNQVSVNTNNTTGFIDPTFLESGLFSEGVIIDTVNGVAGTGKTASGGIIGTRQTPSNNITDAESIAIARGTYNYVIKNSMTLSGIDLSSGHKFIGDSSGTVLTLDATADTTSCSFENLTLTGVISGSNQVERCFIIDLTNVSGVFHLCSFSSSITMAGATDIYDCFSRVAGSGYPAFSVGAHDLTVRNYRGSFGLEDAATGHLSSIGLNEGQLTVESTCLGGEVHMRGVPFDLTDNSDALCTVLDETEGVKVSQIPFNSGVAIDVANGFSGTGLASNGNQIGTRLAPSNNLTDTKTIADREGFNNIYVINTVVNADGDFSNGYTFIADTIFTVFSILNNCDLTNCSFKNITIQGQVDGFNTIKESLILSANNISGFVFRSEFRGNFTFSGAFIASDCFTTGSLSFDMLTGGSFNLSGFRGELSIDNILNNAHFVDISSGSLTIGSGCTGGTLTITGTPYEIIDNSTGTIIIDLTGDTKTRATNTITAQDTELLTDLWQFKGLDSANSVVRSGDGITEEILTVDGKVLTITGNDLTRT